MVTYQHPPMPFLGGDPWSGLTGNLRRMGHDLTIVTTGAHGGLPDDARLGVVRTTDLTAVATLRKVLRRPEVAREGQAADVAKPPPALLTRVVVPDAYLLSWAAWAIPTVRGLVSSRHIECVITTSPPDSTHLVGLGLGRNRPAWLADFRDGWAFEALRDPFPTAGQRRLDAALERRVASSARRSWRRPVRWSTTSRHVMRPRAAVVPNAWDTDLEPAVAAASPPALRPDRVHLVYTGTLAGIRGHDDRGLLQALRRLASEDPDIADRLRLVIAGQLRRPRMRVRTLAGGFRPIVQVVGALPRSVAVALQRRGDALLLITSHHRSIAHGKLFEYLASGRPVLGLAGDNEPARIVRETQTGDVVDPEDVDAIMAALRRVADRALPFAPRGVERYTATAAAEVLARQIEPDSKGPGLEFARPMMTQESQSDIDTSNAVFWSQTLWFEPCPHDRRTRRLGREPRAL